MRNLSEFTFYEWVKLDPVYWFLKQLRNDLVTKKYIANNAAAKNSLSDWMIEFDKEDLVAVSIAFENSSIIDLQSEAMSKYFLLGKYIVADNSRNQAESAKIKKICDKKNVLYIKLPQNPVRHANRNHSMALQWVYENVIKPIGLKKFGFLDHDLIPIEFIKRLKKINDLPIYGHKFDGELNNSAWTLWAGFCFFNIDKLQTCTKFNFLYDFSNGLDTGGRNYNSIYKKLPQNEEFFAKKVTSQDLDDFFTLDEEWLHFRGAGYVANYKQKEKKFLEVIQRVSSK